LWDGSGKSVTHIDVDLMEDPEAAAESAHLAMWAMDALKQSKKTFPALAPLHPVG
jgi:hypothetical protein